MVTALSATPTLLCPAQPATPTLHVPDGLLFDPSKKARPVLQTAVCVRRFKLLVVRGLGSMSCLQQLCRGEVAWVGVWEGR